MQHEDSLTDVSERPIAGVASGCLYAALVVALSAGMLFLNSIFCLSIYSAIPFPKDEDFASRAGQMFFFTVPLVLLIIEWHVLDRLQRLFRRGPQ